MRRELAETGRPADRFRSLAPESLQGDRCTPPRAGGYSLRSILVHWMSAVMVLALFFTHEGEPGSTAYVFHVGGGAIAGLFLLWRVWHRIRIGAPEAPAQAVLFNVLARIVHWGLLLAIGVVVVSGYLLPWTLGQELDVFGIGLPSPIGASQSWHGLMERVHDVAGHLFVPLLILHVLGAMKHAVRDRRGAGMRMIKPVAGGR